jgi:hypothetical protein
MCPLIVESSCCRSKVREFGQKIHVHGNTIKEYLTKMGVHRNPKKSAPKTTAHQQSVIKARLKLLTQNFFLQN